MCAVEQCCALTFLREADLMLPISISCFKTDTHSSLRHWTNVSTSIFGPTYIHQDTPFRPWTLYAPPHWLPQSVSAHTDCTPSHWHAPHTQLGWEWRVCSVRSCNSCDCTAHRCASVYCVFAGATHCVCVVVRTCTVLAHIDTYISVKNVQLCNSYSVLSAHVLYGWNASVQDAHMHMYWV